MAAGNGLFAKSGCSSAAAEGVLACGDSPTGAPGPVSSSRRTKQLKSLRRKLMAVRLHQKAYEHDWRSEQPLRWSRELRVVLTLAGLQNQVFHI
jgi:hypothetical protein